MVKFNGLECDTLVNLQKKIIYNVYTLQPNTLATISDRQHVKKHFIHIYEHIYACMKDCQNLWSVILHKDTVSLSLKNISSISHRNIIITKKETLCSYNYHYTNIDSIL